MMKLDNLLEILGYKDSSHYRQVDGPLDIETAHLFRAAGDAGVNGVYVFETSPDDTQRILSPRPAVYVAQVGTEEDARGIHRKLWNLGYAPFLIVLLPNQIRVYTGFAYSQETENEGLLSRISADEDLEDLIDLLRDFKSSSIDTGFIWKSEYSKSLDQDRRVDKRLLLNLQELGEALQKDKLPVNVSHALIGKFVYLSYLRSNDILTDEWIVQQGIDINKVFSSSATVLELKLLVEALEDRFNGRIFPIDFNNAIELRDEHVALVSSIFTGAELSIHASKFERQLHLDFKAYDFSYIPVETLSAIYEQFISNKKEKGAIYTPEVLADYVLAEMEWSKRLKRGMKVFDPACGSGVFLVLAFRRLIEKELHNVGYGKKLKAEKLYDILWESIYGVEKESDACYVAEFSLILTLLHYAEPRELQNLKFKFPPLHNTRIFNCDFFNFDGKDSDTNFWQEGLKFDWITGNPPWIELKPFKPETTDDMKFARAWMADADNVIEHPIGGKRIAEAFSWLVTYLLEPEGIVGLVMPATSLFNLESKKYREAFFSKNEILRITNFANLRDVLFGKGKSDVLPAITMVYRRAHGLKEKPQIVHYGPFSINQIWEAAKNPWVIIINENEIRTISPSEAESGDMQVWKFALWGTYRDKRNVDRIQHLFPTSLEEFCQNMGWGENLPREGAQLRDELEDPNVPWVKANVKGQKIFDIKGFEEIKPRYRFSFPISVLKEITEDPYIRSGEETLRLTTTAPHVILSAGWQNFALFSDQDFIVPPRQMVISAPKGANENETYLRALAIYLSSSLVAYYLFFQVPEWGIARRARLVLTREVRKIPIPNLTIEQAKVLANLHCEVVRKEQSIAEYLNQTYRKAQKFDNVVSAKIALTFGDLTKAEKIEVSNFASELQTEIWQSIDNTVFNLFSIPQDIRLVASEFVKTRLMLDKASTRQIALRTPTNEELMSYALQLRDELDNFLMGNAFHRVSIVYSKELIECCVEITNEKLAIPITDEYIRPGNSKIADLLEELSKGLREQVSQWVYVQKGLRLYDGPRVHIYKTPRLIDWTMTQAMDDAADIIGTMVVDK